MRRDYYFLTGLVLVGCKAVVLQEPKLCGTDSPEAFTACVSAQGVKEHLLALQQIADQNNGTRAAGTSGYEASVEYVAAQMTSAGYQVSFDDFVFSRFEQLGASIVTPVGADPVALTEGQDFLVASFSGADDLTAPLSAVDLQLGAGNASNSGCEPGDFVGFPAGNIALLQRGTCTFDQKVANAAEAGASAVLIMNQGNTPDRTAAFSPSLSPNAPLAVLGLSTAAGEALAQELPTLRLFTNVETIDTQTRNVIAESVGGDPDRVIVIGAHLDSVPAGPGINDNGSGTSSLLEVASKLSEVTPANKLRFIWWGAEELGLLGSFDYVENLSDEELQKIALNLNFDMVASPNYVREIYDGDGSSFGETNPAGSDEIERVFEDFFSGQGLSTSSSELVVPSDSTPFVLAGIPAGGLFTGANEFKTAADAQLFGGESGAPRDACYHSGCDTIENINEEVLEQMVDAIGFSTLFFAQKRDASFFTKPRSLQRPQRHAHTNSCHGDLLFE